MKEIVYYDTLIVFEDMPDGTRGDRHSRERQVVNDIIRRLYGDEVKLAHKPSGAPYLAGREDLYISISHSASQVVVAINNEMPVGIDTETLRPQLERVKDKYLTLSEQADWPTPVDRLQAWCIKEAAYKTAGLSGIDFARDIVISRHGQVTVSGYSFRYSIVESSPSQATVFVTPSLNAQK